MTSSLQLDTAQQRAAFDLAERSSSGHKNREMDIPFAETWANLHHKPISVLIRSGSWRLVWATSSGVWSAPSRAAVRLG